MAYTNGLDKPSDYFVTKLFTGNGSNGHAISGLDFQPAWVWLKNRNTGNTHEAFDSVRGATKTLYPDRSDAEYVNSTGSLTSFNSDGFTVGSGDGANKSGSGIVSWNWVAGTSFTNDASATGIGSIDSTGSVNTDAGFSIISWTGDGNNGATIAHGLGVTPAIVITKRRSAVGDWLVGGSTINTARGGANSLLLLNTTAAMDSNSEVYQTFSSTTFQVGVNAYANTSGSTMISYCFAEKQGYSKFGSYTGNGSTDGTFVYTGFKPAWLLVKSTAANDWILQDTKRSPHNVSNVTLFPNDNGADVTNTIYNQDILSNGFKARTTHARLNGSGVTYIYMAIAENPFVTSTGVPATAR